MIREKPLCLYCHGVCGSNNPKPVYLKKIEDGWKCPQCNLEYYEDYTAHLIDNKYWTTTATPLPPMEDEFERITC